MNLTASKCGIEAIKTPSALEGYLVINTLALASSPRPPADNYNILLVVGFNYNLIHLYCAKSVTVMHTIHFILGPKAPSINIAPILRLEIGSILKFDWLENVISESHSATHVL